MCFKCGLFGHGSDVCQGSQEESIAPGQRLNSDGGKEAL